MPRQARMKSYLDYYHVMMRGNNRENIFNKEKQKQFFIDLLDKQKDDGLFEVAAYCLMNNHVHLVVKGDLTNISTAIKTINIKYAMKFNRQLDRIGHVFQDRYKSEVINDERYLLQVVRYVHNNPVKAMMVKKPTHYRWSSYNEYIRLPKIINLQQKENILRYFTNIKEFEKFHSIRDDDEYLEIKEDLEKHRLEHGQEIITRYCRDRDYNDYQEALQQPKVLKEIIKVLLKSSKLSHRQIAYLLGISNSVVHKINLQE